MKIYPSFFKALLNLICPAIDRLILYSSFFYHAKLISESAERKKFSMRQFVILTIKIIWLEYHITMRKLPDPILLIGSEKVEIEIVAIACKALGYDQYETATVSDIKSDKFKLKNYSFAIILEKFFIDQLKDFVKLLRNKQNNLPIIFFSKYSTVKIKNTVRLPSITLVRNMEYAMKKLDSSSKEDLKTSENGTTKLSTIISDITDEEKLKTIIKKAKQQPPVKTTTILDLEKKLHLYDTFVFATNNVTGDYVSLFFHEGYVFLVDFSKTEDQVNQIYNWQDVTYNAINVDDQKVIRFLRKSKTGWRKSEFIWNASKYLTRDTIKALNIFPEGSFKISLVAPSFIISRYQMRIKHFSLASIASGDWTLQSLQYRFPTHFDEILKAVAALYFGNIVDIVKRKSLISSNYKTSKTDGTETTIKYKTVVIKEGFLAKIINKIRGL